MFCGNCGKELPDEAKLCLNCGREIGGNYTIRIDSIEQKQEKTSSQKRKWIALAIIFGIIILIIVFINLSSEPGKEFTSNNQENNKNTIADYKKPTESDLKNAEIYYKRGVEHIKLGNYKQAIAELDKAIELNPNYEEAYFRRGTAYGGLGQYQQSIDDLSEAIKLKPDDVSAHFSRGMIYLSLGQYQRTIDDCNEAVRIDPNLAFASDYEVRGLAYLRLGQYQRAIEDFDRAIERENNYASAYLNRGIAYLKLGNKSQAFKDFKIAARLGDDKIRKYLATQGFTENDESDAVVNTNDQQIKKHCEATFGQSYILIEQCVKGEKRAKANIERMSVSENVIKHCAEVFGNSYMVMEKCIEQEQGAKSRLGY